MNTPITINDIILPPGTEVIGESSTPVYDRDGKTIIYVAHTIRLKVPYTPPENTSPPASEK